VSELLKKTVLFLAVVVVLFSVSTINVSAQEYSDLEKSVDSLYNSLSTDVQEDLKSIGASSADIFALNDIDTEIIAASIRGPKHAEDAAKAGADIATIPYKVIMDMTKHPLTDKGIEKFLADWESVR